MTRSKKSKHIMLRGWRLLIPVLVALIPILVSYALVENQRIKDNRKRELADLIVELMQTEGTQKDKNALIVRLYNYGSDGIMYLLNLLELDAESYENSMPDSSVSIAVTGLVDRDFSIPIHTDMDLFLNHPRSVFLISILERMAKLERNDTFKLIGDFIAKDHETLAGAAVAYNLAELGMTHQDVKHYCSNYLNSYLNSEAKYRTYADKEKVYISIYAFRSYLSLKRDGIIIVTDHYEQAEREADLKLVPKAQLLEVSSEPFLHLDLSKTFIEHLKLKNVKFEQIDLLSSKVHWSNFENTSFLASRMDISEFYRCIIRDTSLFACLFWRAKFLNSDIIGVDFSRSIAPQALFLSCSKFKNVNFFGTNLEGAYFLDLTLEKCNFEDANLKNVTFNHVEMDDFTKASLKMAKNIEHAKFIDEIIRYGETSFPSPVSKEWLERYIDEDLKR